MRFYSGAPRNRKLSHLVCLLVAIVLAVVWTFQGPADPVYKGRRLSAWLTECNPKLEAIATSADEQDPELSGKVRQAREAANALRAIGPKAVPYLLVLASSPNSASRRKARSMRLDEWALIHLGSQKLHRAIRSFIEKPWTDHRLADAGFKTLGETAKPGVPGLIRLLESEDPDARETAADALGAIGPAAREAVPALIQRINDPEERIEDSAVEALFAIRMEPKVAVPALVKLLEANEGDFTRALHLLGNFGEEAKAAVPAILPFLGAEDAELRAKATNVLKSIDPVAAGKAGIR